MYKLNVDKKEKNTLKENNQDGLWLFDNNVLNNTKII